MENREVRLIDANALLEQTEIICGRYEVHWTDNRVMAWIDNAPTIDPESLRQHGKWRLNDDGSGTCLNCYRTAAACWDYDNALPYCPHCGAKMDRED